MEKKMETAMMGLYIYIYIETERERERLLQGSTPSFLANQRPVREYGHIVENRFPCYMPKSRFLTSNPVAGPRTQNCKGF